MKCRYSYPVDNHALLALNGVQDLAISYGLHHLNTRALELSLTNPRT